MSIAPGHEATLILLNWADGNPGAHERLMPLVYEELKRMARDYLRRERQGHTLQPTALVHEAYLRMVDQTREIAWQSRAHFFGVAASAMRRILVDHARSRLAAKRGGGAPKVSLEDVAEIAQEEPVDLVELDDALARFATICPRQSRVVELKFFGGMEVREIALVLHVSEKTVKRDWIFARHWLRREIDGGVKDGQ